MNKLTEVGMYCVPRLERLTRSKQNKIFKMSLSKCTNPFKNTYRRCYPESKKDDFVARLKQNIDSSNFNVEPNLHLDRVLLSIKDAVEQTFPLRKVSNKQAKKY